MGILKFLLNKMFNKNSIKNTEYKTNLKYDTIFTIDYLNIDFDTKLKNAKVIFPSNRNEIIINDERMYFNTCYIKEVGFSSDKLYKKIYTKNFAFWITPCDYNNILNIMKDRGKNYQKKKHDDKTRFKTIYNEKFYYDEIDDDIYKCYIADKSESDLGNINCGGNRSNFKIVESRISDICKKQGGRCYKTLTPNTKFVIIFACALRTASNVNHYRSKGYKVTSFENALKYFNLADLWDINKMENEILRIKKTMS